MREGERGVLRDLARADNERKAACLCSPGGPLQSAGGQLSLLERRGYSLSDDVKLPAVPLWLLP